MKNRYKVILSNKRIYKEIELLPELSVVTLGTTKNCDVRLRKDLFFDEFEIMFEQVQEGWKMSCKESTYISSDGIMKLASRQLNHGDEVVIKYQNSNQEVFKLSFMLDFEFEKKSYDRVIDISGREAVSIGTSAQHEICLHDQLLGTDEILLKRTAGEWQVIDNNTKYGVYINGQKIRENAVLKDYDFITIVGYSFYYKYGKLYTAKESSMECNGLPSICLEEQKSHMLYPKFNRNTRQQYIIPEDEIEIQQPVPKIQPPKKNIVLSLIPSIAMLGMVIVLRGIMGGGGSFVIYSACSMSLGIIMSVVSYIVEQKDFKKQTKEREEEYLAYIEQKKSVIKEVREIELKIREELYQSLDKSIAEVEDFGKRIFEKDYKDKDFLQVCMGTGTVEASCKVEFTKQEFVDMKDPISQLPEEIAKEYRYIKNAPIVAQVGTAGGIGIVGRKSQLYEIMKNMTLDLAIRHFYKDIKLFYMFDQEELDSLQWVRWLEHVHNDDLNIYNFMCDEESKSTVLEYLYTNLSEREKIKKEKSKDVYFQHLVVFVLDSKGIAKHPISKYFEKAAEYNVTFIFFEQFEELLPKGCTEIIRLAEMQEEGVILESQNCTDMQSFHYPKIEDSVAEQVALRLGAVYVDEVSLESEMTKNITVYELLNILSIEDLDLTERWSSSEVYKTMAAPLGVKRKNEVVYLDISDKGKAHGPHGLVAGTTGSGKSEILQSYVLSMASLFHPYDVGFVIIDFKGGGMANQFKDLPHLIGTITNIDGREINRSLLSIKAELVRRQELFSQSGVNHINDYIKLFKKGKVTQPLPHLIMIVDEFAELKAEYPDFMKEIISAARIGRTLGVHLILATQKPSGVVDNQIWSNSKFKLCLKVQTKEDSNEVIKTPLAAEIVEPGRAYFQVGNNEIFELFQSAYSGARVTDGSENQKVFQLYELNGWGKRKLIYTNKKQNQNKEAKNQLQVMVEYMKEYCDKNGIEKLNGICQPSLEDKIYASSLHAVEKDLVEGIRIPIGIYDDPEQQTQADYILNLSENNTYIIGSSQSGKTTLLQTMIYELMSTYTPSEVNLYIIDCGNMALKVFEDAKHVGGVALTVEEEKVQNLFKMIERNIDQRKSAFAMKGLGTYKAYVEAGFYDMPQILLIIDNMAVFREHFGKFEDALLRFAREGSSVGINLICTGTQTNAMGFKALANYGNRIAFGCNDKGEYSNLFERCRMEPKDVPGRGLCILDKRILEFHTALAFEGEKEIIRVENMKAFIQENAALYPETKAKAIPQVPEVIRRSTLMKEEKALYEVPYRIPYGIDYAAIEHVYLDLLTISLFGISGRDHSGKTNFIMNMFETLRRNIFTNLTKAYVLDSGEMQLESLSSYGFVEEYSTVAAELAMYVDTIYEQLEERQEMVTANRGVPIEETLKEEPLLLLVIDNNEVFAELTKNKQLQGKINTILKQYKKLKVAILFSNIENAAIAFSAPEMLKVIKENKKLLVFDDISNIKVADVLPKYHKEFNKPIKPGDGYLCLNGEISKVKTVLNA